MMLLASRAVTLWRLKMNRFIVSLVGLAIALGTSGMMFAATVA